MSTEHLRNIRATLASLREVSPRLNAACDNINKIVNQVETVLSEDLRIGITAEVGPVDCRPTNFKYVDSDEQIMAEVQSHFAYGRVNGQFRLHVHEVTLAVVDNRTLAQERIIWSNCTREVKLATFRELPKLLEKIADHAVRMKDVADTAIATSEAMMAALGGNGATQKEREW